MTKQKVSIPQDSGEVKNIKELEILYMLVNSNPVGASTTGFDL